MTAVSLFTGAPRLANDMAEVLRLFLGQVTLLLNEAGGEITLRHSETVENGVRIVRVTDGEQNEETRETVADDAVIDKRLRRRQAKLCVYRLLKRRLGIAPPWGSLTGVRPTRLLYANLARGLSPDEALNDLRAVFDVSPEKAALLRQVVQTQQTLPAPRENEIDVYVGIPFCVSRCAYCSFLSGEVGDGSLLVPYVEALEREIGRALTLLERSGLSPRAFYMGGGTPTALPAPLLRRVLRALSPILRACREVTVEAGRPDTIDRARLQALREAGVTRISVNPQTKHDETLRRIGRRHTCAQTEAAYRLAREMGFTHINMDVIAGLPGEDTAMFADTLAWVRALSPESLTVHTLSIKRASLLHLWEAQLPDGDMVAGMVRAGSAAARALGMTPYYLYRQKYMAGNQENTGYALPGRACLYNVDMMEETLSVLALGAGAASKRVQPRRALIRRAYNVSDIRQYIARVDEMAARKEALFAPEEPENSAEADETRENN